MFGYGARGAKGHEATREFSKHRATRSDEKQPTCQLTENQAASEVDPLLSWQNLLTVYISSKKYNTISIAYLIFLKKHLKFLGGLKALRTG